MAIELMLLTPALVACILVIAAGARYVDARGQASDAAFAAARAASLTTNQEAAVQAGRRAAAESLAERGQACATLTVVIDAGEFQAGGEIQATITCVADLSDLSGIGLPGHKSFTSAATVPLEQHREFS
jgi:Flp pilus assembly protein TadG